MSVGMAKPPPSFVGVVQPPQSHFLGVAKQPFQLRWFSQPLRDIRGSQTIPKVFGVGRPPLNSFFGVLTWRSGFATVPPL